jgi:hypothetical protein
MNKTGQALLSVLDKAIKQSEPDTTPQTTAFFSELRRTDGGTKRNWPEGMLIDGFQPAFTSRTLAQFAWHSPLIIGEELCAESELVKLRELQTGMEEILERSSKYSLSNVSNHLVGIRDQIEADVKAGKELSDEILMPSHEVVQNDFRAKQAAFNSLLVMVTHEEVVPLAKSILERFERVLEGFLRNTEEGDRAINESFDLEYHPSLLWKAAAGVAQRYTIKARIPNRSAFATPKSILGDIVEI